MCDDDRKNVNAQIQHMIGSMVKSKSLQTGKLDDRKSKTKQRNIWLHVTESLEILILKQLNIFL